MNSAFSKLFLQGKDIINCDYCGVAPLEIVDCEENPCNKLPAVEILFEGEPCVGQPITFTPRSEATFSSVSWQINASQSGSDVV